MSKNVISTEESPESSTSKIQTSTSAATTSTSSEASTTLKSSEDLVKSENLDKIETTSKVPETPHPSTPSQTTSSPSGLVKSTTTKTLVTPKPQKKPQIIQRKFKFKINHGKGFKNIFSIPCSVRYPLFCFFRNRKSAYQKYLPLILYKLWGSLIFWVLCGIGNGVCFWKVAVSP